MNGPNGINGWKNLKQRLSFKGLGGCCGATWSPPRTPTTILIEQEEESEEPILGNHSLRGISDQSERHNNNIGMNLRMALEVERNLRVGVVDHLGPPTKSLMRLIKETDGVDLMGRNSHRGSKGGSDWVCCVCMERKKGAAFIPCGHAFCRICSRELRVNRGSCPVCNRSIVDVLDIF